MRQPGFTVRGLMVAVAIVAGFFAFIDFATQAMWTGRATIPLQFTVLDAETGRPISGASIQLVRIIEREYLAPPTRMDGGTTITIRAMCGGDGGILRRSRNVSYFPWTILAESNGYQPFRGDLEKRTSDRRFHDYNAVPPPIVIRLQPSGDPSKP
jgi:hypothetical protein